MIPKGLIIVFLFIGSMMVLYQIVLNQKTEDKKEVITRYIPKTLDQEMEYGETASNIFKVMFSQPSPWISGVNSYDDREQEKINKYYVSQA